jgi:hypothetical protein
MWRSIPYAVINFGQSWRLVICEPLKAVENPVGHLKEGCSSLPGTLLIDRFADLLFLAL